MDRTTHEFVRFTEIWGKRYAWGRRLADNRLVLTPAPQTWFEAWTE